MRTDAQSRGWWVLYHPELRKCLGRAFMHGESHFVFDPRVPPMLFRTRARARAFFEAQAQQLPTIALACVTREVNLRFTEPFDANANNS